MRPALFNTGLTVGIQYPTPGQKAALLQREGAAWWSDVQVVSVPRTEETERDVKYLLTPHEPATCRECWGELGPGGGVMHDTSGRSSYRICKDCKTWHQQDGTYC